MDHYRFRFLAMCIVTIYLFNYAETKPVDEDQSDSDNLQLLADELNSLQVNAFAYPDEEEDLSTTNTPLNTDEEFAVENIISHSTTAFPAEDALLKSLIESSNAENEEDDEESINEDRDRQHEILIIVTQTTTATVLTFVVCFVLICVLFCILSLCVTMGKTPRPMAIAVQPASNNIAPLIATKATSNLDSITKKWTYNSYKI